MKSSIFKGLQKSEIAFLCSLKSYREKNGMETFFWSNSNFYDQEYHVQLARRRGILSCVICL